METQFQRIQRLPPYVFSIVNDLKQQARARGEDIIDFGMGNPDQPTPPHIVNKLVEAAQRKDTHRYSASKGIPRNGMHAVMMSRFIQKLKPSSLSVQKKVWLTLRWRQWDPVIRYWFRILLIQFILMAS